VARLFVFVLRKRSLVLAAAALGAVVSARTGVHAHNAHTLTFGFFDGPG
jgi:hypothetical protein